MAKDADQSVKIPLTEFVKGVADQAGRAAAREIVNELDILPRLGQVEEGVTNLRLCKAKIYGAMGVIGVIVTVAVALIKKYG